MAEEQLPGVEPVRAERLEAGFAFYRGATPFPRLFTDFLWVGIGPLATDRYLILCTFHRYLIGIIQSPTTRILPWEVLRVLLHVLAPQPDVGERRITETTLQDGSIRFPGLGKILSLR